MSRLTSYLRRNATLWATLFALLLVVLPFLFWYSTWFGRRLSDEQIEAYLQDASRPRRAQHALVQIGERLSRGDESVRRWYPQVMALASSPVPELRQTAAWIMGQDPRHEAFRETLAGMLADASPMVRRNAALALAAFRDPAGRGELKRMLRSSLVHAPEAGRVQYRLKPGNYVNPGTLVARVNGREVRAELPGEVRQLLRPEGSLVRRGEALVEVSPDEQHVWEALRALYLVGTSEDAEDVTRYARGAPGMAEKIQQQAQLTLARIARGR
ncbi:MAG TPA: HEAT repeat domain-containing protein [Bryobacteraceae bacterium]|nr:HEAT repeat domain-containing protein [Bryobacteraceae bacterium]